VETLTDFVFESGALSALANRYKDQFATASPFPHVVIDDFLPPEVLDRVLEDFPEMDTVDWQRYDTGRELKLQLSDPEQMGQATRHLLNEFNGHVFVEFLEQLSAIKGLLPDPHFYGGGLHQIRTGGYLKVHADFNHNQRLGIERRLNGLLYLNKDWSEEWGGHLELWNHDMTRCEVRLLPVFNRFVLFSTSDDSNHGHPDPLRCPPQRARRSIALYYYTNSQHDDSTDSHTTLFRQRPGEDFRGSTRQRLKPWIPPAIIELRARLRR
jgi:hypothetical protein